MIKIDNWFFDSFTKFHSKLVSIDDELTYSVCILEGHDLIIWESTGEDVELIQGTLELTSRPFIVVKCTNVRGLTPICIQSFSLLCIRLFIVLNSSSIDVNCGLFALRIVNSRQVNPFVFWDSLNGSSPVHCLVHIPLKEANFTLV